MRLYLSIALLTLSACTTQQQLNTPSNHTNSADLKPEQAAVETDSSHETSTEVADLVPSEAHDEQATETALINEPEEPPTDLLTRLSANFTWETHTNKRKVDRQINRNIRNPDHFFQILERSTPFLSMISTKLEARGMPAELAFLPFVESGFEPTAFSQSGAAGLWQFMPSTARYLGMHTDWWYDERLDIDISTDKALDYLTYLNKRFDGDWEITLAAYNGGEGHVANRIRRAGNKSDFWSLRLKNETAAYVPKLLAVVEIVANPEKYGVSLPTISPDNLLASVQLNKQVDLRLAAKEIGLDYQELRAINPGYLRWITSPSNTSTLLVPSAKKPVLLASISKITTDDQIAWDHYRVQRGDTLIDIARQFGTTVRALVSINQIRDSRIYQNQDLLIPKSDLALTRLASQSNTVKQLYVVKPGDSLWEIASKQSVPLNQIRRLNQLNGNNIRPGRVLVLAETFTGAEITYQVRSGDSLSTIASRFQVAVADIRAWNAIKGDLIRAGQKLTIRPAS